MKSSGKAQVTFDFDLGNRSDEELHTMKEVGYVEDWEFAKPYMRQDGYFCGSCRAFEHQSGHQGFCLKFQFRDLDFGCCDGWYK